MTPATHDEALKKNTDCVYFLASPLTCKKGNECEFRHSESARINPRDCRYWLVGSCLNAHCPFRHPPLEGLSEGDPAVFSASLLGRSRVPCYYFSQGYCAKGDKCTFMHTPTSAEFPQRLPKPNAVRTVENQASTNKANESFVSKMTLQANETPLGVSSAADYTVKLRQRDQDIKMGDDACRLSEESDSLAVAKTQTYTDDLISNRSRKNYITTDGPDKVKPADSNFLHLQEIQAEDDALCEAQATDMSTHEDHVEVDRIKNGTESEELWEESSFDVLVDDGTDQMIYAENMEFISSCDVMLDPLGGHNQAGLLNAEEYANYDYEQYYDGTDYDLATYESYEQQLGYGQFNSFDYRDGVQREIMSDCNHLNDSVSKERKGASMGAKGGHGSYDLRNHIVKRRRAERSHRLGEDVYQRHQPRNGYKQGQGHQGGKMRQNVFQERDRMVPEPRSKLMRKSQDRGEAPRIRPIHGRLGDLLGKRAYHKMGTDYEAMSPDNVSVKSSDQLKSKSRKGRSESANMPCSRAAATKSDGVSFQGPKTLAQIKAEKMKVSNDGSSGQKRSDSSGEDGKNGNQYLKREEKQIINLSPIQDNRELMKEDSKDSDFEGPKPLSVILKEKRKELNNIQNQEEEKIRPLKQDKAYNTVHQDSHPYISGAQSATGSVMDDNDLLALSNRCQQRANVSDRNGKTIDATELDEHGGESTFDLDNRAYVGDFITEDVEFDDEDDDDFAKKLGGFLP